MRRRRARRKLVDFSQAIEIPGAPVAEDEDAWLFKPIETSVDRHHVVMMEAIQKCIETDYGRLMILAPPGSAKSTYAAVVAPAWAMGAFPGIKVLMTSYAAVPIIRASKRTRQLVSSDAYRSIWPENPVIPRGSSAADEWELSNGSSMYVAGLLGGITSSRCDLGVIDDAVAGREEADSETMRRKTRQAYDDDFLTRLKPKASIIFINTRWHLDDLAGSILPEDYDGRSGPIECRDGQTWMVLNIQAKCERKDDPVGRKLGEYLWPNWFAKEHWAIYESNARTWNALYQQRPTVAEGGQFQRDRFLRHKQPPKEGLSWWITSDWAVTKRMEGTNPDFTELIPVGIDGDDNLFLQAGFSGQVSVDVSCKEFINLAIAYKAKRGCMEAGTIKNAVWGTLHRHFRRARKGKGWPMSIETRPTTEDKVAMAQAFRGMVNAGKVSVQEGVWGNAFIEQCCAFPFSTKDDKVDAAGLIGRIIDEMDAPVRDPPVKKRKVRPFSAIAAEMADDEDEAEEARRRRFHQ